MMVGDDNVHTILVHRQLKKSMFNSTAKNLHQILECPFDGYQEVRNET